MWAGPASKGWLGLVAITAFFGCGTPNAGGERLHLLLTDSVDGVMPSTFPDVLLLRSGWGCVPDSYLHRVHCFDPETREWASFGREGSGPGEFRSLGPLLRVASRDSLIGVVDIRHGRLSVHDLNGTYQGGASLPPLFRPMNEIVSDRVFGLWTSYDPSDWNVGRLARIDLPTGDVVERVTIDEGVRRGAALDDGSLFLQIGEHEFARYTPAGRKLVHLTLPRDLQAPIYPSERDIEVFQYELRQLFGREPRPAEIEERSRRPLHPVVREANLKIGPRQTVWIASARDRTARSFLDVFLSDRFVGSVEVRHRLLGFDILDGVLVVLVERPYQLDGDWVRGLDWYVIDIEEGS